MLRVFHLCTYDDITNKPYNAVIQRRQQRNKLILLKHFGYGSMSANVLLSDTCLPQLAWLSNGIFLLLLYISVVIESEKMQS